MKKGIVLLLISLTGISLAFAGGQSGQESTAAAKLPMRYYMPGAPTAEAAAATRAINEALDKDKVGITYQPFYIPWDQWVDKINLMLSTGEEFELFHIMGDFVNTAAYASRNSLAPLSALINRETPNLKKKFDDVLWDCLTIKGDIYGVPAFWLDNSGDQEGDIRIRKEKYDQYGIPIPRTPADIITALETLQQRWAQEDGVKRYFFEHQLNMPSVPLHRSYNTWPFFVSLDGIFQVRQDGSANLFFDTDEFRRDAEFMNTLYTKGLIHPDILNMPADTNSALKNSGELLMGFKTGPRISSELTSQGIQADVLVYHLNPPPEKPVLTTLALLNSNSVPITAKHPEAGLKFLDWVYKNQDNQDLLLYGIKGKHWNPVGNNRVEFIKGPDNNPLYRFDVWMIEDVKMHRFDVEDLSSDEWKKDFVSNIYPEFTLISPVLGFNFDSSPVRVEYANTISEYTISILPIKTGVIPYAGNFEAARARMKAAGCDKVIAEYRRQLTEYIAQKKK
jgi:putative aldouronate transport system substrate-binding protein